MIKVFNNDIADIKAFGNNIEKVYAYGEEVWSKSIPDYLCFTALEQGSFTLTVPAAVTSTNLSYVEYSLDGRNWTRLTIDSTDQTITTPEIPIGGKVWWRGSGVSTGSSESKVSGHHTNFSATADFNVSGNIMSLLYPTNFEVTSFPNGSLGFCNLFKDNSHLISAEDLSLSVTTPVSYCFFGLFLNCTGLIKAPSIPLTTFSNTSMVCRTMFSGCTSLVKAPDLPVAVLASQSYYRMFYGCTSLNYVKCLATDISATDCTSGWLSDVSSTGTFVKAENVTWPSGASGIPSTWVQIEKRTMPSGYKQVEYIANPNKPESGNPVNIDNGIVLDPSQDTLEIATKLTLDSDGYIAHYVNGGALISNTTSPAQATAKIGRFYFIFVKNTSTDRIQFAWTRATATSAALTTNSKIATIAGTPQVARVELASGDSKMYLNGTQIVTDSRTCDTSDMGTETGKLYGHTLGYNWTDPIYYYKHWRNGVLIADYVACVRESDNEPSFYDFVSNTFKVPTRTGFFTAGEEI